MLGLKQLTFIILLIQSSHLSAKVWCFQSLHGLISKNQRDLNQVRKITRSRNDSSAFIREAERLITKIREWSQIGSRGQTIYAMRETGAKLRLKNLMEMSSVNEVIGQVRHNIMVADMTYFTVLKHYRHYQAFQKLKTIIGEFETIDEFKIFISFLVKVRNEIRMKEILIDDVFNIYLKHIQGERTLEDVYLKVKKNFEFLEDDLIRSEIKAFDKLFRDSDFAKMCTIDKHCFLIFPELPKLFSYDFSSFFPIRHPAKLFDAIDREIEKIEERIINRSAKLYRHKPEYVAIKDSLKFYFPSSFLENPEKLFVLGRSANHRMDRIDSIRRSLYSSDPNEFLVFKRKLIQLRKNFPDAPEVKLFGDLKINDLANVDASLKESFDAAYFSIKASVIWVKLDPSLSLQKFGGEIGVKVKPLSTREIFEFNNKFPASKIIVLRESLYKEKISAIVTLLPDEVVYRILHKVSDLVTWIPGLRESKFEIKSFFQTLIDEKSILKTYPKVDELAYGPGTIEKKYRAFKETAAPNSLGEDFVNIFARRADERAQQTYDKFFKMLEKEIAELEDDNVDVSSYKNFKTNHPLVKLFEQMGLGREELHKKGSLAPWFDNPPNSARYFRLLASGLLVGTTAYGGYRFIDSLAENVCSRFPDIGSVACDSIDMEVVERIDNETLEIVMNEAEAAGISIKDIESNIRQLDDAELQ